MGVIARSRSPWGCMETNSCHPTPRARANADRFLEYGKLCYRILQPAYAFTETFNTWVEEADVHAARLTHIFWAQCFGPAFIRSSGPDVLIHAPAWRNENLGDGGILYVLAASPYLQQGPRSFWQQAKSYFAQHVAWPLQWGDRLDW